MNGLRLLLANVSTLRLHQEEVFSVDADILAVVETRATTSGQRVLRVLARKAGWVPFWGPPLPSRGGGTWDASAGGMAIFVRVGVPARMPKARGGESSLANILWG